MIPWHFSLDNPNFLGWLVVTFYGLAAVACAWAALRAGAPFEKEKTIWWLLALVLVFLGVNKQLNLQTFMIFEGRHMAAVRGLYSKRQIFEDIFCVVFMLLGLGALFYFRVVGGRFIRENGLAFAGTVVLGAFVMLRAITIMHQNRLFGVALHDKRWAWTLELTGSSLIAFAAAKAARNRNRVAPSL